MQDKKIKITTTVSEETSTEEVHMNRRDVLKNMLGLGVGTCMACSSQVQAEESKPDAPAFLPPQEGDCLVHAEGENIGKPLNIDELQANKKYINCWPMDPASGTIRDASRFNKVLAIKLDGEGFDDRTKGYAENGIVAYSAICTHQGCDISAWVEDKQRLFCYCHYSQFDPRRYGKVTYGPAKKKLPILPVKISDKNLIVAGNFSKKPGGSK